MGKSVRSKRLKRLRTIKREISTAHYDKKAEAKMAILDAALAGPKIPVVNAPNKLDIQNASAGKEQSRGRAAPAETSMDVDAPAPASAVVVDAAAPADVDAPADEAGLYYGISLKPKHGKIRKRGKSRGKIKKDKHKQRSKLKF